MTKQIKVFLTGAIIIFLIAPSVFSQTISRIDFHYFSGVTTPEGYSYDMKIVSNGSTELNFNVKSLSDTGSTIGSKVSSFRYNYIITSEDWKYLTDFLNNSALLEFPGLDSTNNEVNYGSQLFRSKIWFNNNDYYKIPEPVLSKFSDVMSPFYSKMKSLIPENIAVDFFQKKRDFYKAQKEN